MSATPENVEDVSPYKLLRNFSKSRLLRCLFLALLIHAAVIGGLSTDYIYRTWIDPKAGLPETAANPQEAEPPPGEGTAKDPAGDADGLAKDGGDEAQQAPVVNRVTEKADPKELPDEPGGLGISIDDVKD